MDTLHHDLSNSLALFNPFVDDQVHLWLLRLLVPLKGYVRLLGRDDFNDDEVARAAGLSHYLEIDTTPTYDRQAISGELRRLWHATEQHVAAAPAETLLERNVALLAEALRLSWEDACVLNFIATVLKTPVLEQAVDYVGATSIDAIVKTIAVSVDMDGALVAAALSNNGTLVHSGIIINIRPHRHFGFSEMIGLLPGLEGELGRDHDDAMSLFRDALHRAPAPKLDMGDYPHLAMDLNLLRAYLTEVLIARRYGVNVLFYGPPGTGKTELSRVLAHTLGTELFEIAIEDRRREPIRGDQRLRAFRLAQRLMEHRGMTMTLFDEIEDLFRETGEDHERKGNQSGIKAWVHRLLEENPVPTFWVTNNLRYMDSATRRRFDYVLELKAPPRRVREKILDRYLTNTQVSSTWKQRMANHDQLAPALVERAAKVVQVAAVGMQPVERELALSRALGNMLEVLGHSRAPRNWSAMVTDYRLDLLNTDCNLSQITAGLRRQRQGRLCLYGPPGTGKTAFGRHVADCLDMPLMVKRASDIFSPWLGETEKNMAKMFQDAQDEGAVLLLDEVDTFLQDRRGAQPSWEISQVNEMLTQMENFDGIFIASTNLVQTLDRAALRRFDLKVRFDYLNAEQTWVMFVDAAKSLGIAINADSQGNLCRLSFLTPGDFATVLRQARLRSIMSSHDLYERLVAECAMKPEGQHRTIGF